jgi:hypothetical protein
VPPPQRVGESMHFVQNVSLSADLARATDSGPPASWAVARWVRLVIDRPSTQWGASLWRLQVWGAPLQPAASGSKA